MKDMLIRLSSIFWISWVFIFASCGSATHHFYAGDEGNLLAVKEKGDLKVAAGYTPHLNSLPSNNINFQLGYSPIKHLSVYGNFFRIQNNFKGIEDEENSVIQKNATGAIGTYLFKTTKETEFAEFENSKGLLFDLYAGYSFGEVNNFFFEKEGRIDLEFQKYFVQGGVHIFLQKVNASFALRYAQLQYLDGGLAFGRLSPADLAKKEVIENNNPFSFLESALKISFGLPDKPVRAYMTITGVYDFGDVFLEIQPSTLQLGMTVDIDSFF